MVQKVMKVVAVSTEAPDRPGTAAQMATVLKQRGVNLKALWAWPAGEGMTRVVGIPEHLEQLRALAAEEGQVIQETPMVWLEGPDEVGALTDFLAKVAGAGINIVKMHALAVGGQFAAVFGFADEQTVDRVIALMGG